MKLVFDFIALSFEMHNKPMDENFQELNNHVDTIRDYYDKNACLNPKHTGMILDLIRFCVRKNMQLA